MVEAETKLKGPVCPFVALFLVGRLFTSTFVPRIVLDNSNVFCRLFFFLCVFVRCRRLTGLRKDVYCNLRIPDQCQTTKDDINIVLLAG